MTTRLKQALDLLGYDKAKELHQQSNLLGAIELFAVGTRDGELEAAAQEEIQVLRAKVAALRAAGVNVTSR